MKKIYLFLSAVFTLGITSSCNDYLDKLPDDRAEVDNVDKVQKLLVSAYPKQDPTYIFEMSSDNVDDNGTNFGYSPKEEQLYRWKDVETEGNDDPKYIWNHCYTAVASANLALQAIENLGTPAELNGAKAEALLCRAYAMFRLSTVFCMAWDPAKAEQYLGLPYPKVPDVSVNTRGTLKQLYENINADIETALPLLDDTYLKVPKYHFNAKAAYAFAARFNLFYLNYDKTIKYANEVLGSNPSGVLRNMNEYASLTIDAFSNKYISTSENANLLILPSVSRLARTGSRFNHNMTMTDCETFWTPMPWAPRGGSSNNCLVEARKLYGNNQKVWIPTVNEYFEVTDKINDTGFPHIVRPVFTTDQVLLERAEAYVMKKKYAEALADMNAWITAHTKPVQGTAKRPTLTQESLNKFINDTPLAKDTITTNRDRSIKKTLHPQGFTLEEGTQLNMIYMLLQMRRIETFWHGGRFLDIKRFGITVCHLLDGEDPIFFKPGDLRGAIQLPLDVIDAGLEANPRDANTSKTPKK